MKRRILHLITRLPVGGAERLLADVVRMLETDKFDSVVCCIQDGGAVADEIAASGIPVVTLGLMAKGGFDRQVVPAVVELIRRERIDLVHSHLYHANLYGRLAARRAGIVAVSSVHNAYTKRKWYRHLINRWLTRERHCAAVIAVSEDIRRDILCYDHAPPHKVIVLPNGIDPGRVATTLAPESAKARLGFGPNELLIGCVGRLEEQKGHTYLLSALAGLRQDFPRLRLAIAGDGRLRDTLLAQARAQGIDDIVRFLGTRSDMAEVLRAIDLYVMPSLWGRIVAGHARSNGSRFAGHHQRCRWSRRGLGQQRIWLASAMCRCRKTDFRHAAIDRVAHATADAGAKSKATHRGSL